ncbi:MAG: SdiA-regulated domain-containing protein [Bacteroidota bacterium]|nr:SdiA-regulated domain-containing protein [Bacteroidota bacterium]
MRSFFIYTISFTAILSVSFCSNSGPMNDTHYSLGNPDRTYVLPVSLNEISGITLIDNDHLACVQDEIGTIYIYDLVKGAITKEYSTKLIGDYEGIALVGKIMYLLRSDGVIVECSDYTSVDAEIKEYNLQLPSGNNEGLCYDKANNRLLIAAKTKPGKGSENKDVRLIYEFNLLTKKRESNHLFKIHVEQLEQKAKELDLPIPYKTNKKTGKQYSAFNFRTSEIAVHPVSGWLYILSANDKLLLLTDPKGNFINLVSLPPEIFNKAEGITFLSNADMLISNEAQSEKATLLSFSYRK